MGRKIFAVICSYAAASIVVLVASTIALMIMGVEGSHEPGTFTPSVTWCLISLTIGALASFVGGWMCGRITRDRSTIYGLIGLILVFGILEFIRVSNLPRSSAPRELSADLQSVAQNSLTPLWVLVAQPLIGAAAAFIGARVGAPKDSGARTVPPSPR